MMSGLVNIGQSSVDTPTLFALGRADGPFSARGRCRARGFLGWIDFYFKSEGTRELLGEQAKAICTSIQIAWNRHVKGSSPAFGKAPCSLGFQPTTIDFNGSNPEQARHNFLTPDFTLQNPGPSFYLRGDRDGLPLGSSLSPDMTRTKTTGTTRCPSFVRGTGSTPGTYPDTPCMPYMLTLGWFWVSM